MYLKVDDVSLKYSYVNESVNRETGLIRKYYNACFQQGEERPIEFGVSEDVYRILEDGQSYCLALNLRKYPDGFSVQVVSAECLK